MRPYKSRLLLRCLLLMLSALPMTGLHAAQVGDTLKIAAPEVRTEGLAKGQVTNDMGAPLGGVIVRAMRLPDSVTVNGAATDSVGRYALDGLPFGNYVIRCEATGYTKAQYTIALTENAPVINVPTARIMINDMVLGEAVVVGTVPAVTVVDDTVAYNADAFQTPEGAMVESLIEQIPGAEITEDGKIKINGKEYSKILVDGKEFFGDDPQATLKNLPANIIKRIKTYDRKSAQARLTGIDDGVENNVIDIEVKPNMFKGIVGNVGLSAGNHDRYNTRFNANRFRKDQHFSIVGSMNNVNNPVFAERGSGASNASTQARSGLTSSKSVGLTYAKEKRKKYKFSGNVRYGHSDAENKSDRHAETVYSDTIHRFSDTNSHSDRMRHELNANAKLEWTPDTLSKIEVRPNFSYNMTRSGSASEGGTHNWNGSEYSDTTAINRTLSKNAYKSEGSSESINLMAFRRLSRTGRNVTVTGSYSYSNNENYSNTRSLAKYYLRPLLNRNYNRNFDGNSFSSSLNAGISYNEPLLKNTYLQLSYNFSQRHARSNRYGQQFDRALEDTLLTDNVIIDWQLVPVDTTLSSCNANDYTSHSIKANMRHNTAKMNLSYGVHVNPRHNETNFIFGQRMNKGLVKQDLMNWSPSLNMRYRFTKRNTLSLNYNGNSSEPNIEELQEIIDKSNPQYVRYGNPNLKPSFTHNVRGSYNLYGEKSHRSLVTNWSFTETTNSTSNMILTESSTGIRVSKLMNINGRWNTSGNINFNTPLDSLQRWNVSTASSFSFSESTNYNSTPLSRKKLRDAGITNFQEISYDDIDKLQPYAIKNHSHALRLHQSASLRYRKKGFSWQLGGGVSYYKMDNSYQRQRDYETYDYNINGRMQAELPLNFQLSSNINFVSRHGYSSGMRKNLAIWNGQLTKRFLKNNAALVSLQAFDLLHQRNSVNRTFSGLSVVDTHSMMLKDYFLLSFQYNINTMRKRSRQLSQQRNQGVQQRNQGIQQRNQRNAGNTGSRMRYNSGGGTRMTR
ncbi:MAG: TonB-dependent receptor [Bacteroidaceae bacterium]|nr:TonB-dependent receptor [Bacteroidaceae bacterium]